MNVFELSENLRELYGDFIRGYIPIRDSHIRTFVEHHLEAGVLWPPPLIQINPRYKTGSTLEDLIQKHGMDRRVLDAFREDPARPVPLYHHQEEAIELALQGRPFLITTGTGSGKTWSYLIPILNHVLQDGAKPKTPYAVLVYPMNALVNSQLEELRRLKRNYENIHGEGTFPVRFARFTGQESKEEKEEIRNHPPHILLTNYVMMELLLLRHEDRDLRRSIVESGRFYVMDEIHTYRGRQGADVALMNRRFLSLFDRVPLCIGASATMASPEEHPEARRAAIARFATQFFGVPFTPDQIVEETLDRRTQDRDVDARELRQTLESPEETLHALEDPEQFARHPFFIWLENTFGVRKDTDGRLRRQTPRSIEEGVTHFLTTANLEDTPENRNRVRRLLEDAFLKGARKERFSFKLHHFFSQGGDLRGTLENPPKLSLEAVNQIDGEPAYPIRFCRHCGQHYYVVIQDLTEGKFLPVDTVDDREDTDDIAERLLNQRPGYLLVGQTGIPLEDMLPDEWRTPNGRIKKAYASRVPETGIWAQPDGTFTDQASPPEGALPVTFIPAPFSICLQCGRYYTGREKQDYRKLADLGTEGRALATTIHLLAVLPGIEEKALRKALSFTDNRQDAAFQAGFFNDFVHTLLVRGALYRAVQKGPLTASSLAPRVREALQEAGLTLQHILPERRRHLAEHAPEARLTWEGFQKALEVFLYADMGREWRVLYPNLEQTGLLRIRYRDLDTFVQDAELAQVLPELDVSRRKMLVQGLLDYLRFRRAIATPWASSGFQLRREIEGRLNEFWHPPDQALSTPDAFLEGKRDHDRGVSLSIRSVFGQWVRRTFRWTPDQYKQRMEELVKLLLRWGFLEGDLQKFQLSRNQLVWEEGDGSVAYVDVYLRTTTPSSFSWMINPFFQRLYREPLHQWLHLRAAEHTAQVSYENRIKREQAFREGRLSVIFCSPTMELGIDIRDLLVVHMRNVPPTPANYAQRSGRAGRKGQPALVVTYCGSNSHDQYFFHHPEEMVSGEVRTPWIDFANEDLLRTHIHSLWFAELGVPLGQEIGETLVDRESDPKGLPLKPGIRKAAQDLLDRKHAVLPRIHRVIQSLWTIQTRPEWLTERWIEETLDQALEHLDRALDRWRELYRYAQDLWERARTLMLASDRERQMEGERLDNQARALLRTLVNRVSSGAETTDFYPYRYLASEGFLPGYAFPRRPLRAAVPVGDRDTDWIQRPGDLAIYEFAPRNFLYHEGGRYVVARAMLPAVHVRDRVRFMKGCTACGFFTDEHKPDWSPDRCPVCGGSLEFLPAMPMMDVITYRRARITSDEAARSQGGFAIETYVRFDAHRARISRGTSFSVEQLIYAPQAVLRIVNRGYVFYPHPFYILPETGEFFLSRSTNRIKNEEQRSNLLETSLFVDMETDILLWQVPENMGNTPSFLPSLGYALLEGMIRHFELERREMGIALFPARRTILFYETAVGGLSVLRRIAEGTNNHLARIATAALERLHFEPQTLEDRKPSCEAACYGCLMSYENQRFHARLDRFSVREALRELATAPALSSEESGAPGAEHKQLEQLLEHVDSERKRKFLQILKEMGGRLPDAAQVQIPGVFVEADFFYEDSRTCVFIDGPVHDDPRQKEEDRRKRLALEERGYRVVVIRYGEDLGEAIRRHRDVFGV